MKKILAALMVIALCIFTFGMMSVSAAETVESGICGKNVTYTLDSNGLLTISGRGEMTDSPWLTNYKESIKTVVIKQGVTTIDSWGFTGCINLTNVSIPDSVTSIGETAFGGCEKLTSITLPDNITRIYSGAFYKTGLYNDWYATDEEVLYINNYLIQAKTTLSGHYDIKPNTKLIATLAFASCKNLTSVTLPDGLTEIGTWAFTSCSSLTSATIPNSVTYADAPFYSSALSKVYYGGTKEQWSKISSKFPNGISVRYKCLYTFETNGSSPVNAVSAYELQNPPETTLNNTTFIGWYDNPDFSGSPISFPYWSETDITLYAKWVCEVTYTNAINTSIEVTPGESIVLPTPPSGYKYIFTANGEPWNGISITENVTVNVEKILSNECDILEIISPYGGTINKTDKIIDFRVANSLSSITPNFKLSDGATWKLYSSLNESTPISKTIDLTRDGRTYTRYIKVTAADGNTTNIYTVTFRRNTKSISPVITTNRDKVTITATNCEIYYTTDGTIPTIDSTKYIGVFSAPSKSIINAIAVEKGKDEASNVVTVELEYITTTMIGIECFDNYNDTCDYAIMIQSDGEVKGEFIVAIYDIDGRLIGIKIEEKTINNSETVTSTVEVNGTPHSYKAFFWNSSGNIMPLCENVEGLVIK